MWVAKNENDPFNRKNTLSSATNTNTPNIGSGAGGGAPVGAGENNETASNPSTINPVAPTPQQKTATVQDYLGANKVQGNQLGTQFKDKLTTKATADKGAIDTAATNITNQANAGSVGFDPGVVNAAKKDPTKVANDPNQLSGFLKQWNAAYTGPSTFEGTADYTTATKAAQDAATKAAQVGDAGGRKQILQDEFGVYGQGNKGLDQTLLQNSDQFAGVQELGKNFAGLPDYLTQSAKTVNTATQAAADKTAATKKNTQDLFSNSLTDFQSGLTDKVKANTATAAADTAKIKADLASGDVTKISQDMAKAGYSSGTISDYLKTLNSTYNVKPDVSNYYTYNPATAVNNSTVASKDDYAKAAALQKLTGADYSGVLNPADAAKAGTWNNSNQSYNTKDLNSYLKTQVGQQDKELLGKTTLNDAFAKINMPSIVDPKNFANKDLGTKSAQTLIDVAKRNGISGRDANGQFTNLANIRQEAARALVGTANGGQLNTTNPAIQGLLQFVRSLDTYMYGKSQY